MSDDDRRFMAFYFASVIFMIALATLILIVAMPILVGTCPTP